MDKTMIAVDAAIIIFFNIKNLLITVLKKGMLWRTFRKRVLTKSFLIITETQSSTLALKIEGVGVRSLIYDYTSAKIIH